jgi:hypothetical protein
MKNMGRAVKIALVTSSLPACERSAEVQESHLSHLLTIGRKSATFGLVRPRGKPR